MNTQNQQHDNMFAKGLARSQQNYLDALKTYMEHLSQRCNESLKHRTDGVGREQAIEQATLLTELVKEIGETSYKIAAVGTELGRTTKDFYEMSEALARRANAYADVFGTPTMTINYTADGEPLGADALLEDYDCAVFPPEESEHDVKMRDYEDWLQRNGSNRPGDFLGMPASGEFVPGPFYKAPGNGDLVVRTSDGISYDAGHHVTVRRSGGDSQVRIDTENTNQDYSILFVCGNGITRLDVDSKGGYSLEDLEPGTEEYRLAQIDLFGDPDRLPVVASLDELNSALAGGDKRTILTHNGLYRFDGKEYVAHSWGKDSGGAFTLFDREGNEAFDVKEDGSLLPYYQREVIKLKKEVDSTPAGSVDDLEFAGYAGEFIANEKDDPDLDANGNVIPF